MWWYLPFNSAGLNCEVYQTGITWGIYLPISYLFIYLKFYVLGTEAENLATRLTTHINYYHHINEIFIKVWSIWISLTICIGERKVICSIGNSPVSSLLSSVATYWCMYCNWREESGLGPALSPQLHDATYHVIFPFWPPWVALLLYCPNQWL